MFVSVTHAPPLLTFLCHRPLFVQLPTRLSAVTSCSNMQIMFLKLCSNNNRVITAFTVVCTILSKNTNWYSDSEFYLKFNIYIYMCNAFGIIRVNWQWFHSWFSFVNTIIVLIRVVHCRGGVVCNESCTPLWWTSFQYIVREHIKRCSLWEPHLKCKCNICKAISELRGCIGIFT